MFIVPIFSECLVNVYLQTFANKVLKMVSIKHFENLLLYMVFPLPNVSLQTFVILKNVYWVVLFTFISFFKVQISTQNMGGGLSVTTNTDIQHINKQTNTIIEYMFAH